MAARPLDGPPDASDALATEPWAWAERMLAATEHPCLLVTGDLVHKANPAAGELLGTQPSELVKQPLDGLFVCEDDAQGPVPTDPRQAEGTLLAVLGPGDEIAPVAATWLPLAPERQLDGLLVVQNISEQVAADEELAYRKALLESQNEASVDGILIVDDASRVVSMNQRFRDMWGLPDALLEVGGRDDQALASVLGKLEDPDEFLATIEWLHEHPEAQTRDEVRFTDGRVFERWSTPVPGEEGTYHGRGWYFRDITDRKLAEQALTHRARERARLAELEQLLRVTSHNLVTPLRMMTLYSQLVARRYADVVDEEDLVFLDYIVQGGEQMRSLLGDLRTYAQIGSTPSRFEATDAGEVVDRVLRSLNTRIQATEADVEVGDLPALDTDPEQLRLILTHLMDNALKFHGPEPPRIQLGTHRDEAGTVFTVRDHGPGIPERHHQRVFELFERLSPEAGPTGTGMGLALCQRMVERMGGSIWIQAPAGGGTVVAFRLPDPADLQGPHDPGGFPGPGG